MAKFYAVHKGHAPGVYLSWPECQAQTKGFSGAKFKSFATMGAAEQFVANGESDLRPKTPKEAVELTSDYIKNSLSVDAACSGNPGQMEYQCVYTEDNSPVFSSPVYPVGTNNIGEFLAVVDALRYLQETNQLEMPVYTDSISAIAWVRNAHPKTQLARTTETEDLWQKIDDAVRWLDNNSYKNPVLKWETKQWGESKADFGRK